MKQKNILLANEMILRILEINRKLYIRKYERTIIDNINNI